jgi:two-component system cell cycle response regulator
MACNPMRPILIADDDELSRKLLSAVLTVEGYEVEVVADGAAAWAALERTNRPELVISDWNMPECDGLQLCERVRRLSDGPYTYLLLLSARNERDDVARGLAAGADDYVIKPFYGRELIERVRAGVRILDLQRRLRDAEARASRLATRDDLTGLWNRRAIMDLLHTERERARRSGEPLSLAVVDVDHFKLVNDRHGHLVGDEVLRQVSSVMAGALRSHEHVGRFGGEEFLVLLPGCGRDDATTVAERMRLAVASEGHTLDGGGRLDVSVSAGVATLSNLDLNAAALIARADEALYAAKHQGRNRVIAAAA